MLTVRDFCLILDSFKKITGSNVVLIFKQRSQLYGVIPQLRSLHVPTAHWMVFADPTAKHRQPFQSFFGGGSLIGGSLVGGSLIGGLGSSSFGGGLGGSSSVIITANTVL